MQSDKNDKNSVTLSCHQTHLLFARSTNPDMLAALCSSSNNGTERTRNKENKTCWAHKAKTNVQKITKKSKSMMPEMWEFLKTGGGNLKWMSSSSETDLGMQWHGSPPCMCCTELWHKSAGVSGFQKQLCRTWTKRHELEATGGVCPKRLSLFIVWFFCATNSVCVFATQRTLPAVAWHQSSGFLSHKLPLWHFSNVMGCHCDMTLMWHVPKVTDRKKDRQTDKQKLHGHHTCSLGQQKLEATGGVCPKRLSLCHA